MVSTFILCVLLYSLYSFDRVNSAAFNVVGSKDEEQVCMIVSPHIHHPNSYSSPHIQTASLAYLIMFFYSHYVGIDLVVYTIKIPI